MFMLFVSREFNFRKNEKFLNSNLVKQKSKVYWLFSYVLEFKK